MKPFTRWLLPSSLLLASTFAHAVPPKELITHNQTSVESNGYIDGTIPSKHPTKAHSDNRVKWVEVRMACFGHIKAGRCGAMIKMATNTPEPVELGFVSIDLNTGDIEPKSLDNGKYHMIVNDRAEVTLFES